MSHRNLPSEDFIRLCKALRGNNHPKVKFQYPEAWRFGNNDL